MRESGFTLIELTVALTLLAGLILGIGSATAKLSTTAVLSADRVLGVELAQARVQEVIMDPVYKNLVSRYAGVEDPITGHPQWKRTTFVSHTTIAKEDNRVVDFKRVTVSVEGPGLDAPIIRSATVAAP